VSDVWWRFEDHVCRQCLGRVVSRQAEDGQTVVRCSNCGTQAMGEPSATCACGIRGGNYAGLRCARVERAIPGLPAEIAVTEVG
jgi:hypothetical protein